MSEFLKILFLASEAEPYVKVGGLADVAGSLPLALRSLPCKEAGGGQLDVRLVLPLHHADRIDPAALHLLDEFPVKREGGDVLAQVFETSLAGMPVYFINGEPIANAASVYSMDPGQDREKYAFFSLAALEFALHMDWQPELLHANDWHTALAIYALRCRPAQPGRIRPRSVFTLHNLPYMGGDATEVLRAYGLKLSEVDALPGWARSQPLPLGLWAADAVVPVSPGYGSEILTPAFGCGLDTFLQSRADSITGILNGLDLSQWDPGKDQSLAANFTADSLSGRAVNKSALQKQLGLTEDPHIPLLAMIGRIDPQKGVDIAIETLRRMSEHNWQFIILGSSDPALENAARALQVDYPGRVCAAIRYDAALSRLIYGGADMFLMPSRYEPCGLAQMIAMRYGCVPVVHATGGLKDTVEECRTGFLFHSAEVGSMQEALWRAFSAYEKPGKWEQFQRNGMQEDFSWPRSASQYAAIYRSLMELGST